MSTSLSDILSDAPAAAPAVEPSHSAPAPEAPKEPAPPTEPAKAAAPAEPARGADGKFVAKQPEAPAEPKAPEKQPEPPKQPEMTEKERALLRAAEDERRKRQALEQELARLRPQTPAGEPEKPKQFWDDPDGALKAHEQRIAQREVQLVLNTTERIARSKYTDFDDQVAEFAELVKATPGLAQQWLSSADPAEFAYRTGKNHKMLKEAGNIDALKEKIAKETEARVRAQVEAEFKAKQDALEKERAALPPSLSDVRGAPAQPAKPVWSGPTPLDAILSK